MTDSSDIEHTIPAGNLFLASAQGEYSYADLLQFKQYFLEQLADHEEKPIAFCAPSSDLLIFMIASCWIANIPFISIDPELGAQKQDTYLQQADSGILISHRSELSNRPDFLSISTFDLDQILERKTSTQKVDPLFSDYPEEDGFGYFFTSGTAGRPKLVPLKRRQMISAAKGSAKNLRPGSNECWLLCLPLHHVGGISVIFRSLLYGSAIYRTDHFETTPIAKRLANDKRITAASLVPTMLKRLLDIPEFNPHPQFKGILLGGGPIFPGLLKEALSRKIPVIPSYGMTETCAQIAANPLFGEFKNETILQSVGRIFPPNKIEIRDEQNACLDVGQSGTIWLKGPQVFDGYLNQSSEDSFDNSDWFNTGDYGRLDADGNLYIEARRTDLIITGGENVSPYEIETALKGIDGIRDAAVFGLPDKEWGQKVVAAIVLKENEKPSTRSIQKVLKKKLETFKIPKEIVVVKSLSKTKTGKIKRHKLIELLNSH